MGGAQRTGNLRPSLAGIVLLAVCAALTACFYPPEAGPRQAGRVAPQASSAFVHKVHEEVLKQN